MKLIAALAVAVPLLAAPASAQVHAVTAVRHWSVGEVTRVAVEVTGPFEIRSDRLHNPERVYFDIHNARPQFEGHRRFLSEEIDGTMLKRIRVAETQPDVTRVVLELGDNVEATPSQLTNPNRLMIELRPMPAPATPPVISEARPAPAPPASQPFAASVPPAPAPKPVAPDSKPAAPGSKSAVADAIALPNAPVAVPLAAVASTAVAAPAVAASTTPADARPEAVAVAAIASPPASELAKS
ncbi:MAG TPA: AMIN domain-containing protein, partial [Bryobacteraceae bacterium]|nr:AMIN domain-containing protein [Bryobacteraceae bacterium]